MKTFTKENIPMLSAADLLASWTSGMGASGKEPAETWAHVQSGKLLGQVVNIEQLTAIAELKCKGSLPSFVAAIAKGYLSPNHESQYESGDKVKTSAGSVGNKGHVLTAEQYMINCIKLGLDANNVGKVTALVEQYYKITDKTTKADLHIILTGFVDLFCNCEQNTTYGIMLEKEELAKARFAGLTDAGYTDIREMIAGRYVANLPAISLGNVTALASNGFTVVGMQPISPELFQITFKETETTV